MIKRKTNDINTIIIHCSDLEWGSVEAYRKLHRGFGWEDIGYHYVILNSFKTEEQYQSRKPDFSTDGLIEKGRDEVFQGAHVKNHNEHSIGICLVGNRVFSSVQFNSLLKLIKDLSKKYPIKNITGHYEYDTAKEQDKSCPNIEMDYLRNLIAKNIN